MTTTLVREVMTRGAETVEPETTLQVAAQKMKKLHIGFLTVHDERVSVMGVITDRDIVVRAVAEGALPESTLVCDVMSAHVVWCHDDAPVAEAVDLMQRSAVRRLVVLDRKHRLAGVLSIDDVARAEGLPGPIAEVIRHTSQAI